MKAATGYAWKQLNLGLTNFIIFLKKQSTRNGWFLKDFVYEKTYEFPIISEYICFHVFLYAQISRKHMCSICFKTCQNIYDKQLSCVNCLIQQLRLLQLDFFSNEQSSSRRNFKRKSTNVPMVKTFVSTFDGNCMNEMPSNQSACGILTLRHNKLTFEK